MNKVTTVQEVTDLIQSGDSLMIGGFLNCGTPTGVIHELLKTDKGHFTLIANDTGIPEKGRGLLIVAKRIKKAIVSHIGTNPETGKQMHAGTLEVELVPQGTLAERIHAAGAGLGGILTPTGLGTVVQEGKEIFTVDGKTFMLEKPLSADIAIIYGTKVDRFGNVSFYGTTRNFNPIMATAAKTVIVEADEYIDGALDPNDVIIPGVFVNHIIIKGGTHGAE